MKLRQMEVFHALMRGGSVTDAARILNVTQPAVSQIIKHTEGQLGMKLFARIRGRLVPTPEAERLLPDIEEIFARVDAVGRMARDIKKGSNARLAIAASNALANSFVPTAVAQFRKHHSDSEILIESASTLEVAERVSRRSVDVGISYAPTNRNAVDSEPLGSAEICCLMRRDHPLASRAAIDMRDLRDHPVIGYSPGTPSGFRVHKALQQAQQRLNIPLTVTSSMTACCLVNESAGVALAEPSILSGGAFPQLIAKPFHPTIRLEVIMVFEHNRPRSRIVQAFAAHLREEWSRVH